MDTNEIIRLINNLVRKARVIAVDHDAKKCRVKSGGLESNWLDFVTLRAGTTQVWNPPTEGEQVLWICPGGETADGVALGGLFSEDFDAPSNSPDVHLVKYPDGAVLSYDFASHTLKATLPAGGAVVIDAPASVTVNTKTATINAETVTSNAPNTNCTGNLTVDGLLTAKAGLAVTGGAPGGGPSAVITGKVEATDDIEIAGISFLGHKHPENDGGGPTGTPQ